MLPRGGPGIALVGAETTIGVLWLPTVGLVHQIGGKLGCRAGGLSLRSNFLLLKH